MVCCKGLVSKAGSPNWHLSFTEQRLQLFGVPPPTSPDGRVQEMLVSHGEDLPMQGLKTEVGSESTAVQEYLLTSRLQDERAWRDVRNARCSGLERRLCL